MKKMLFIAMLMTSLFTWAQQEPLGKITKVNPKAILKYPSRSTLTLEVSTWRRYTNTPFYLVFLASKSPITNISTIEDLRDASAKTNCGMAEKKGFKYSEEEKIFVNVPLSKEMLTAPFYLSGFVVTSGKTTEFRYEVYKNIVTYKHQPMNINLRGVKTVESSETFDLAANALSQGMFLSLYGIDKNGNQICKSCDGIGCEKCKWRGWDNDALTTAFQRARSSANTNQRATSGSSAVLNGRHTKTFPNGDKYTGDFVNGMCTGKGTYIYANGGKYVGDFKNNQFHGKGTFTFAKDKYVGDFRNDVMEGKGTFYMGEEMKYVGSMKNDEMEGEGTMYLIKEQEYVKGIFKNGNMVEEIEQGKITPQKTTSTQRKPSSTPRKTSSVPAKRK